ncbi:MAG: alginate export family protein [Bryobacteraceae bacterium]
MNRGGQIHSNFPPRFTLLILIACTCRAQSLPAWLTIHAEQRTRYETEDVRYRLGETGGDQQIALRTRFRGSITHKQFFTTLELQDARVGLTDSGSTITTQQENFTHPLQAYIGFRSDSFFSSRYHASIEVGRFSRAVGSGRLVGAEAFRNTSSVYDGLNLTFSGKSWAAQAFYFHPVLYTYPNVQVNPLFRDARVGGLNYSFNWNKSTSLEAFFVHNHDGSSAPIATRRNYNTEGGRVTTQTRRWSYQTEAAYQHGQFGSRLHRAWFAHIEAGYATELAGRPRIALQYDYASGDGDPTAGTHNAFDPLFGVRRTDLGPTGIWSLQLRSNLNSPSMRVQVNPLKNAQFTVHHHWMYLAQARDQWRGVGLVDPTGKSGHTIGQQTEFQLRYRWSKYFDCESAYVFFREGSFVRAFHPNSRGWAGYFYISTDVHF